MQLKQVSLVLLWGAAVSAFAQTQAVAITSEPFHAMRMETPKIRVYHVVVPVGQATQFHRHEHDNLAVFLSSGDIVNERSDGSQAKASVKKAGVSFSAASPSASYVHRIISVGGEPFENITIELLAPALMGPAALDASPGLKKLRDTPRASVFGFEGGNGYQVVLPTRDREVAILCLSRATLMLTRDGEPGERWDCERAQVKLLAVGTPASASLQDGQDADIVVIAFQ